MYSYTRDRRTWYVAHHSSILWVRTTAVSITAFVQRSLAETRPLYSRKRPCRRKVLCKYLLNIKISSMLRECTIYASPSCTQKPWNTDARQTESITCAHESMVHELALSLVLLVSYSMRTAHGLEVSPDYRRSSSGRNHMHASKYIRYHKKMPRSSWRKFLVIRHPGQQKIEASMRATLKWRRTRPKDGVLEVLSLNISTGRSSFFSARKSSSSKQKLGFSLIESMSIASSKDVILTLFTRCVHGG